MAPWRVEFEALLRPHLDALYYAALDLSGNAADAEDLVQEAALKGLRRLKTFESGTDFRAWMIRILANTYIDLYRRRRHEKPALEDETMEAMAISDSDLRPADVVLLLPEDIARAMTRLPEEQRAAVVLVDVNGLTNQEAADALGWPLGR